MQSLDNNTKAFLELVRAGLWETDARLLQIKEIDYSQVLSHAEEQSIVGLVAAGIEHVVDVKVPKEDVLQFVGQALQLEQRNRAMNTFIGEVVTDLRKEDIYTVLVKGQGVAQCYERPLWRSSGDIDFLLSDENYQKAVNYFKERYSNNKNGGDYSKETAFYTDQWMIEVHGSLRTCLSSRLDREVDNVQRDVFFAGNVRSWDNGGTIVFLPSPENDVFFVFTHFIKHFYKEGMSLRQVCDWIRLLWTYKDSLNHELLESRIRRAGVMGEWKSFAAVAVNHLGMPVEAMPLYSEDKKWHVKGEMIMSFILDKKESGKVARTLDMAKIFPGNTIQFSPAIFFHLNWLKIKEGVLFWNMKYLKAIGEFCSYLFIPQRRPKEM